MFGAYVVVVERPGLFECMFNRLHSRRRLWEFVLGIRIGLAFELEELFEFTPHLFCVYAVVSEYLCTSTGIFLEKSQKDVFGPYAVVAESLGLLTGPRHDVTCVFCKTLKHRSPHIV